MNRRESLQGLMAAMGLALIPAPIFSQEVNTQEPLVEVGYLVVEGKHSTFFSLDTKYTPPKYYYGKEEGWKPLMEAKEMANFLAKFLKNENVKIMPMYGPKYYLSKNIKIQDA